MVRRAVGTREIGDENSFILVSAQRGSDVTLSFESSSMTLVERGSQTTGVDEVNGFAIEADFTREEDELRETVSVTDIERQCAEVHSFIDTRQSAMASRESAGDYALDIEIVCSGCNPEIVDLIEAICRRVHLGSQSKGIEEESGVLLGIAGGTSAKLERRRRASAVHASSSRGMRKNGGERPG